MTEDAAPDDARDSRPMARVTSSIGAMLGIAVALLLAALPGVSITSTRAQSAFSAATADQSILATASRLGEARATPFKARGPNARRPDFGDTPFLLAAAATLALLLVAAAAQRPARLLVQRPARWRSTARARAPPRA
ncbi:MAG: hypothetical protein ACAH11_00825 [Sphingomonas sp.]